MYTELMIYEVFNQPKKLETALLDRAVSFAANYLQIDVDLIVEFKRLKQCQFGFCDYDDEVTLTISKSLSTSDLIRTLFHEMVHVSQYFHGRLEQGSPQLWYGVAVDDDYENLPWEIEAFDLEQKMMDAFQHPNNC